MLYHLLFPLHDVHSVFNVIRYVTFRSVMAMLTSMIIAFAMGPWLIGWLQRKQIGQTIRSDGPASHQSKKGTPTMGGLIFLLAGGIATLLWARWDSPLPWYCLGLTACYGLLGFWDDWLKVVQKNSKGVSARGKLFWQIAFAVFFVGLLFNMYGHSTTINVPFFKNFRPDLAWLYIPFSVFVIVGTSNAVNLTDGLDGLATVPSLVAFLTFALFAYIAGHFAFATYLQIPHVVGASEVAIFCTAMAGGLLGFLWFNAYPAQVFMGDVGSLALGGGLGIVATVTKNELVLAIVGGIFVLEAVSVMAQVFSFKITGKRVLKMAPLHHHFELKGWKEPKIIVRFWIISIILALAALSTLKIR